MILKFLIVLFLFSAPLYYFLLHQKPFVIKSASIQSQELSAPIANAQSHFDIKVPTIDAILSADHSWIEALPTEGKRVLLVTGDILLARTVNYKNVKSRNFVWPFEKTADILKSADVTFINLETPLINNCPLTNEGMKFCGDPRNIEGLLYAGIDVINIANNHMGNYGSEGVKNTIDFLTSAGFIAAGVSRPVYKDVRGVQFAFLGYNEVNYQEGISLANQEKIVNEITQAKSNADIVIVQFHWGNEYTTNISLNQRVLAHLAIDSGADLVVGNHSHWVQPIEMYKDKLISYSHGNFIFDQEWSKRTKVGVVGKYTFYDKNLIDAEYLPVRIDNYGQPYFLNDDQRTTILDEMKTKSIRMSSIQ